MEQASTGEVGSQIPLIEKAGISNENDEWYTPKWVFDSLGVLFDLDPCSPGTPPAMFLPISAGRRKTMGWPASGSAMFG